jgi:hypothetical protein
MHLEMGGYLYLSKWLVLNDSVIQPPRISAETLLWVTKESRLACTSVRLYPKCYEIGQFRNKAMTQRDDTYDQYLRNRLPVLVVPPEE